MLNPPNSNLNLKISKEEVKFYKREIEASRDFRKKEFVEKIGYEKLIEYYEGNQLSDLQKSVLEMAIINEFYPGFSSIINSTYVQNPSIVASPKNPLAEGDVKPVQTFRPMQMGQPQIDLMTGMPLPPQMPKIPLSALMKSALEWAIKHYDLKTEARLALFDLAFAGFACIECNHSLKQDMDYSEPLSGSEGLMDKIGGALDSVKSFISGEKSQEDVEKEIAQQQATEKEDSHFDDTFIQWWNPLDILFDYRAKVFSRSRYIVKEKDYTLAEFKMCFPDFADKMPTSNSDYKQLKYSKHDSKDNTSVIRVCEMQIKKKDGLFILIVCDSIQEALAYYKYPLIINGFTVKYKSLDQYGRIYPMSRAKMAKKPQDELNHYTTLQMEHAERSHKKIAVFKDGLTKEGQNAVASSDVYAICDKKIPGPVFEAMPVGGVAPENKDLQMLNTENINKLIGTNELAKSGKSESEFATQDALKNQAFSMNSSAFEDALGDLMREVLDTLKDIIMQLWDGDYYFKITGQPGGEMWYTPEMGKLPDILLGDYLIDVDISSAKRKNPMSDRQEMMEIFNLLTNPMATQILMSEGKKLNVNFIKEIIKTFNKNPDTIIEDIPQQPMLSQPPLSGLNPGGEIPQPIQEEPMPEEALGGLV